MNRKPGHVLIFIQSALLTVALSACSSTVPLPDRDKSGSVAPDIVTFKNTKLVKSALYAQHKAWRGVRYKEGGLSRRGVDCSGFIHITFRDRFGLKVPRTTELLAKSGKLINKTQLRPGDLVFFKTGFFKHHVGIYIEKGKFVHASTSKGVIVSVLDNVYWSKHYWKSVRLSV